MKVALPDPEFARSTIKDLTRDFSHLKTDTDFFRFLKYVAVKMIRGKEVNNRWIDYVDLTDDSNYSRSLNSFLSKASSLGILVQHKSLVRFRLNSLYHVFISIS